MSGVTLNAEEGEVAVLLGHNGSGKSTTFSAIAGIIAPTAGLSQLSTWKLENVLIKEKFAFAVET